MIRGASISDAAPIAKALWSVWHGLKARQIPAPLHVYTSCEALKDEIGGDLSRWLVCESSDPRRTGFFALSPLAREKTYKKWGFPEQSVRVEHFACLFSGAILLHQFQLLASHLQQQSILLCLPSALRDAYWAALKAGFTLLGESPLIIGTVVWLYLDREAKCDDIRIRLKRAQVIA